MPEIAVTDAVFPQHLALVREMFREYAADIGVDLGFQNFDAELAELPGKYSAPHGCVLLALRGGKALGCVALRPIEKDVYPSQLKSWDGYMKIEAESPIFRREASETKSWQDNSSSKRGICEMKRLYVSPSGRGHGVGRMLADAICQRARELGYKHMRLDTLSTMQAAQNMYKAMGFVEIAPYIFNPLPDARYMELKLF